MSHKANDQYEEQLYDNGYDKGYEDCRSEMELKIKALLRAYIYSEKFIYPQTLAEQISQVLEKKVVEVG